MGPYCNFCNNRCFTYFPNETPQHILDAYGTSTIIATCPGGQAFEREKVGYCYDQIQEAIRKDVLRAATGAQAPQTQAGDVDIRCDRCGKPHFGDCSTDKHTLDRRTHAHDVH